MSPLLLGLVLLLGGLLSVWLSGPRCPSCGSWASRPTQLLPKVRICTHCGETYEVKLH